MKLNDTKTRRAVYWLLLYRAQSGKCVLCNKHMVTNDFTMGPHDPNRSTFEHLKCKSVGGGEDLFNQALSHQRCNEARKDAPLTPDQELTVMELHVNLRRLLSEIGLAVPPG